MSDDTDVAIMLLYHWDNHLKDIFFTSEWSKKSLSIGESIEALLPELKSVLLCLHAFSGSDSTSAIHGLGKTGIFRKFKGSDCNNWKSLKYNMKSNSGDKSIVQTAHVFHSEFEDKSQLYDAGERLFVKLYGGQKSDTLTYLR